MDPVEALMTTNPIDEAEQLRRGDPALLQREAAARLDGLEASLDDAKYQPELLAQIAHDPAVGDAAYRAALLLDLRGLEVWLSSYDEPELYGTVTAIEDEPEQGPVLVVTLPRRPRQRKVRTDRLALCDVIAGEFHLQLPG